MLFVPSWSLPQSEAIATLFFLARILMRTGQTCIRSGTFAELPRFPHDVPGIERIRFTTSHPRYVSTSLISTYAELNTGMRSVRAPPQADDDDILKAMKRSYSSERCITVVNNIRKIMPNAAMAGDMIVDVPNASEALFERSLDLKREVRLMS
jgi:tRNA-2-methylthio-N6-dimethylallyladenosine synthase